MHKCLIKQSGWPSPGARKCRYRRESQPRYTTMQQVCGTVHTVRTVQPRCAEELVLYCFVLYCTVPCAAIYKVIDVLLQYPILSYPSAPPSAGSRDTIRGSMPAYSFSRYLLLPYYYSLSRHDTRPPSLYEHLQERTWFKLILSPAATASSTTCPYSIITSTPQISCVAGLPRLPGYPNLAFLKLPIAC